MCSFKMTVFTALLFVGYVSAAAKPLDLEEIGRKIKSFKDKALPAIQGLCGFVNSYNGHPQGYPPVYYQGYPGNSFQGYYPQTPNGFSQYPQSFSPVTPVQPQRPLPGSAFEQDDMIDVDPVNNVNIPPPAEIQDVLKNFDKLPKFNPSSFNDGQNKI